MKYLKLDLFLLSASLLYACQKNQVLDKIEVTTTMIDSVVDASMPITLHWSVDVQDENGIAPVTIQFSNTSHVLDFPNTSDNNWSVEDIVEFDAHSIREDWTIIAIVQDAQGKISQQVSTIDLQ